MVDLILIGKGSCLAQWREPIVCQLGLTLIKHFKWEFIFNIDKSLERTPYVGKWQETFGRIQINYQFTGSFVTH